MSQGKALLMGVFLTGGLVGLVPLFMKDRASVIAQRGVSAGLTQDVAEAATKGTMGSAIGTFASKPLDRNTLTGDEKLKIFEAENAVYNAYEEVLTQRFVVSFFEKYKSDKGLPDVAAAQKQYFSEKVVVADEEVTKFLAENKDNPGLQRMPEAERPKQIRMYLENRARSGVIKEIVDAAKGKGEIVVAMSRPAEPRLDITDGGNAFMGPKDAKVTIVEFADFQCPFCARMIPTIKEVLKKYDGKVRWVYRDFPLREIHPMAVPASVAANCAGAQNKYFEMHHKLYDNVSKLSEELFTQLAADLKLDAAKFSACQKDPKMVEEVNRDADDGQKFGVNGTPAYFINGRKLGGAVDVREMSRIIDDELSKKM